MQAVRHLVPVGIELLAVLNEQVAARRVVSLRLIKGASEMLRVNLVQKRDFHQVADPRPECRPGNWLAGGRPERWTRRIGAFEKSDVLDSATCILDRPPQGPLFISQRQDRTQPAIAATDLRDGDEVLVQRGTSNNLCPLRTDGRDIHAQGQEEDTAS